MCSFYITSIAIKQKEKERKSEEGERQRMKERGKKGRKEEGKKERGASIFPACPVNVTSNIIYRNT